MAVNINLTFSNNMVPTLIGGVKRVTTTSSLMPFKYIEEYTVQGQLLSINGKSYLNKRQYQEVWQLVDDLSSQLKNEISNIALTINGQSFSNVYRINSINFDRPSSSDQDVFTKEFTISFERHLQAENDIISSYNVQNLKDIESIDFSISKEESINSVTLIKNATIQYTSSYTNNVCDSAQSVSRSIFNKLETFYSSYSKGRVFKNQTCDQSNKSFSYQERQLIYFSTSEDLPVFHGYNLNIEGNGTFSITENGNIQANKEDGINIGSFKTRVDSLIGGAFQRCQSFVNNYYGKLKLLNNSSPKIQVQNLPLNSSINIDNSNFSATYAVTYSNDPRNSTDTIVNITEEISTNAYKDAKIKVESGTIKGMGVTDSSVGNQKFGKAKTKYESLYRDKISQGFELKNQTSVITSSYPCYLTNANVKYNFSEGLIEFSHTFESDKTFDSKDDAFVSVFVNVTDQGPLHLVNSYLIFGGVSEGKELIVDSQQGMEKITTLEVQFILKPSTKLDNCIKKFLSYIKNIKTGVGFLKSVKYSFDPVGRTFSGNADYVSFDSFRELKDVNPKAEVKNVSA